MFDIKSIKNDEFIKKLNNNELDEQSNDIRTFLIDNISNTGGHLSSNLGDVELTIAIHKVFDLNKDKLLFDVGHQSYTHKILNGFGNKFDSLRKLDGLSPFISKSENPNDIFESGHSSTSISTAMGIAKARDDSNDNYNVISLIGDSSIANGIAFEALNNLSETNNKIIIILNDNGMSINKSVGSVSKQLSKIRCFKPYIKAKIGFKKIFKFAPRFLNFISRIVHRISLIFRSDNIFDNYEINYLGPIDGHNIKLLTKALEKAKSASGSILIHVKTKKGKGYTFAENDKVGKYHGIGSFDKDSGIEKNDNHNSFTIKASQCIYNLLSNDKDAYLISAGMSYNTNLLDCFNDFKDRCIDVGIAEEHAISFANGLALANKHPIISLYSTFMQRGYDEIVHDICRSNSNVIFFVDRAGIVGNDGPSHQGILDVSFIYPIDNTIIASISSNRYFDSVVNELKDKSGAKFIRYQKHNSVINESDLLAPFGKIVYELYNDTNKISIISTGSSVEALKDLITKNNYNFNLLNVLYIKPLDYDALNKVKNTNIFVYDNTSIYEGLTCQIVKYYQSINKNIEYLAVPNKFIEHGEYQKVLEKLKIDEISAIQRVIEIYGKD